MFEELKSRNQVFKKTSSLGDPFIEILNIDGMLTINEKLQKLADYIPEKSKIFLHFLIANNAEITKDLAESSEARNEYLKERNIDLKIICANIGEMDKFTLKQMLGINPNKDIYTENLNDLIAQEKIIFNFFDFIQKLLQQDIINYQIEIDQIVKDFLKAQNICQIEIKRQIRQKISESNKRSKLVLEKSTNTPERIGDELLDQI